MGYTVPEPYVWNESFMTFYKRIDDEHKGLFKSVFDIAAAPSSAEAVQACFDVMASHFANEECIMQYANYPEFHEHKMRHDRFLANLQTLQTPVSHDTISYCKDWLVSHILTVDFKYRHKL